MMFPKRLWNIVAIGVCLFVVLYYFWTHGVPNASEFGVARPVEPRPPAEERPLPPLVEEHPPPPAEEHLSPSTEELPSPPTEESPSLPPEEPPSPPAEEHLPPPPPPPAEVRPPGPIYKNLSSVKVRPPISDNFPLAETLASQKDLPKIPSWNRPPSPHVPEKTPLFIGFTRNWPLLQQCVLAYITAGWPPEDIYVVDNTGTMMSNADGLLSLQNPFYLTFHVSQTVSA